MLKQGCLFALALLLAACNRGPASTSAAAAAAPPPPAVAAQPSAPAAQSSAAAAQLSAPAPGIYELGRIAPSLAQVFTDGHWGFGGQGTIGNATLTPITVKGTTYANGIGTQPPSNGSAHIVYDLNRPYTRFTGQVALNDTSDNAGSPLIFRIIADGKELWRSPPMASHADPAGFDVDITHTDRLELFVDCHGSNNAAHAVWLNLCLKS